MLIFQLFCNKQNLIRGMINQQNLCFVYQVSLIIMSRIATQPDVDPISSRIGIITSNMNRIVSQNKKLQQLLTHQDHFDRLRQISLASAANWERLANLAENVEELSQQARSNRQKIHSSLAKHTDTLNRTLLSQIQTAQSALSSMSAKLVELKSTERKMMAIQLQKQKKVTIERLTKKKDQCISLLKKAQDSFKSSKQQSLHEIQLQSMQYQSQCYEQCRISLGHLSNLTAYFYWKNNKSTIFNLPVEKLVTLNCDSIRNKLVGIEFNQKRVKGQIDWLKSKSKKRKNTVKSEASLNYEPMEQAKVGQIQMSLDQIQYQLIGLGRICDYQSSVQREELPQQLIDRLMKARNSLQQLQEKQEQYSSFYRSRN